MDTEFFRGVVQAPTFFGDTKSRSNLLQFFHLQSALESELFRAGGFGHQLFLFMLNLR